MSNTAQLQVLFLQQTYDGEGHCLKLCQSVGWNVASSPADKTALELLKKQAFDVVIADLDLPQSDSADIVKMILSRHPDQPLIVVSNSASASDVISILREGVYDYLQQPVDALALESSVNRALASKKSCDDSFKHLRQAEVKFLYSSKEIADRDPQLMLIEGLWRAGRIDHDSKLQIALAFQEALTNSLDHGNLELESVWKEQPDVSGLDRYSVIKKARLANPEYAQRSIAIEFYYNDSQVEIIIQDQGKGFTQQPKQPKPGEDQQLNCFGRGLSLIESLMDEVVYSDHGRHIKMVKYLKDN